MNAIYSGSVHVMSTPGEPPRHRPSSRNSVYSHHSLLHHRPRHHHLHHHQHHHGRAKVRPRSLLSDQRAARGVQLRGAARISFGEWGDYCAMGDCREVGVGVEEIDGQALVSAIVVCLYKCELLML